MLTARKILEALEPHQEIDFTRHRVRHESLTVIARRLNISIEVKHTEGRTLVRRNKT